MGMGSREEFKGQKFLCDILTRVRRQRYSGDELLAKRLHVRAMLQKNKSRLSNEQVDLYRDVIFILDAVDKTPNGLDYRRPEYLGGPVGWVDLSLPHHGFTLKTHHKGDLLLSDMPQEPWFGGVQFQAEDIVMGKDLPSRVMHLFDWYQQRYSCSTTVGGVGWSDVTTLCHNTQGHYFICGRWLVGLKDGALPADYAGDFVTVHAKPEKNLIIARPIQTPKLRRKVLDQFRDYALRFATSENANG